MLTVKTFWGREVLILLKYSACDWYEQKDAVYFLQPQEQLASKESEVLCSFSQDAMLHFPCIQYKYTIVQTMKLFIIIYMQHLYSVIDIIIFC